MTMQSSPAITGRLVIPVSNAAPLSARSTRTGLLVKKAQEMASPTLLSKEQDGAVPQHQPALSKEQLANLKAYYGVSSGGASPSTQQPPPHLAVDLYGLDCPVSTSFFAAVVADSMASTALATTVASSPPPPPQWSVSAIVPGHAIVFERKELVASGASSSSLKQSMVAIGSVFTSMMGEALGGDGAKVAASSQMLAPVLLDVMGQETQRITNIGGRKVSTSAAASSAAGSASSPFTFVEEAKRSMSSKAGLVYVIRSNKAVALANGAASVAGKNAPSAADSAAETSNADTTSALMGAFASTILITLSDRASVASLLGGYVSSGNALLVGEVSWAAPASIQPSSATVNGGGFSSSSSSSFPSIGALWLEADVATCVPSTLRSSGVSANDQPSYSRVVETATNTVVSDVWDIVGHRPNRLLSLKTSRAVIVSHPLVNRPPPSFPAVEGNVAVQHLASTFVWMALLSSVDASINSQYGANAGKVRGMLISQQMLSAVEGGNVVNALRGRGEGSLLTNLMTKIQTAFKALLGSPSVFSVGGTKSVDDVLGEMFLLSEDDENMLAAEGITGVTLTGVIDKKDNLQTNAIGAGPSAKELALQVLESTARANTAAVLGLGHVAPSERILFVAKLNPITTAGGLATCFEQFGRVVSCEIPKDIKNNRSKCYAFVEFETVEACNAAYSRMGGVMIDNCAIHVDFCQSTRKEELEFLAKQREAARAAREQRRKEREAISGGQGHKRPREEGGAVGEHRRGGLDPSAFDVSLFPQPPSA